MKALCLVAVLAAFGVAQGASADNAPTLKPYSLRLVLPADSVDCGARSSSLGDVFAAQTGLTVTSANCQDTGQIVEGSTTFKTVTIVIDYLAAAEAIPSQAIFGGSEFMGNSSTDTGLFAKYSDCLNARGAQQAAYTAATGLQVFAAYCAPATDIAAPGYSLVVEAFGAAKAHLYSFTQDPAYGPVPAQVMAAAQSAIAQAGGTVVLADDSHVFYYAGYPVDVDVRDLGMFSDVSQCQAQTNEAAAIYAQAKADGISAFCVTSSDSTSATLTVVASDDMSLNDDYGYNSQNYTSFSECMGDLGRAVQNAQSNNANVLGGICKPSDGANGFFVIDIYSTMD